MNVFKKIGNWAKDHVEEIVIYSSCVGMGVGAGLYLRNVTHTSFNTGFDQGRKAAVAEVISDITKTEGGTELLLNFTNDEGQKVLSENIIANATAAGESIKEYYKTHDMSGVKTWNLPANRVWLPRAKRNR